MGHCASVPGAASVVGVISTTAAEGEFDTQFKTFNYALQLGVAKILNTSKYFVRNGDAMDRCTYILDAFRSIPETIHEQINSITCL